MFSKFKNKNIVHEPKTKYFENANYEVGDSLFSYKEKAKVMRIYDEMSLSPLLSKWKKNKFKSKQMNILLRLNVIPLKKSLNLSKIMSKVHTVRINIENLNIGNMKTFLLMLYSRSSVESLGLGFICKKNSENILHLIDMERIKYKLNIRLDLSFFSTNSFKSLSLAASRNKNIYCHIKYYSIKKTKGKAGVFININKSDRIDLKRVLANLEKYLKPEKIIICESLKKYNLTVLSKYLKRYSIILYKINALKIVRIKCSVFEY